MVRMLYRKVMSGIALVPGALCTLPENGLPVDFVSFLSGCSGRACITGAIGYCNRQLASLLLACCSFNHPHRWLLLQKASSNALSHTRSNRM